jgi:hypothetical protein
MKRLRELVKKTWVYVTATALIVGSSSTMGLVLSSNMTAKAAPNVVAVTSTPKTYTQTETVKTEAKANYSVIDMTKDLKDNKENIKEKLRLGSQLTEKQIEEQSNSIIAAQTPGDKDISADQAAAYAADILKKAFGVDLKGYEAQANFFKSPVPTPNADCWSLAFSPAGAPKNNEQQRFSNQYVATVNSIDGKIMDAFFISADSNSPKQSKIDVNDPAWKEKAEQSLSALLTKNVTVTSSRVISSGAGIGVNVVCELSDGSAYVVRLMGENKDPMSYFFFQNGYDGSLEKTVAPEETKG